MNVNILNNVVREYENFIKDDELEYLFSIVNSTTEDDWFNGDPNSSWYGKNLIIENSVHLDNISLRIKNIFDDDWKINHIGIIHRFRSDFSTIGRHSDEIGHPEIRYGAVLYLNDDYEGGEIVYPDLNLSIKPKSKSLVIHPGNVDHLVNDIKPGKTRYMLTTFIHHNTLTEWDFRNDS
jgi:hypothetical protein